MRDPHQLWVCAVPGGSWEGVLESQQGDGVMEGVGRCAWRWSGLLGMEPWGMLGMEGSWRQREETEGAGRDTGNTGIEYQKCSWRYWKWKGSPGGTGRDSGLMWCAGGACWRQETARGAVGGTWDTLGVIGGCVMGEEPPSPGRVHAPPESSWVFLPAASAQEGLYLGKLLQAAAPATFSSPGISRDSLSLPPSCCLWEMPLSTQALHKAPFFGGAKETTQGHIEMLTEKGRKTPKTSLPMGCGVLS